MRQTVLVLVAPKQNGAQTSTDSKAVHQSEVSGITCHDTFEERATLYRFANTLTSLPGVEVREFVSYWWANEAVSSSAGVRTIPPRVLTPPVAPNTAVPLRQLINGFYRDVGKVLFDRVVGSLLLVITVPLMAAIAAVVRVKLGPGVLFVQDRVGRNGRVFRMYKFRTMRADRRHHAEPIAFRNRRHEHKSVSDPRHTVLGRWLRRRSLDELPQLWNVVRGDMSLVGPRPELPWIVGRYEPWQHLRHTVRPGITGVWQTTIRNHDRGSAMSKYVDLDLEYIGNISLWKDVRMIIDTVSVVCGTRIGGE